jgi:hypothetical protein
MGSRPNKNSKGYNLTHQKKKWVAAAISEKGHITNAE